MRPNKLTKWEPSQTIGHMQQTLYKIIFYKKILQSQHHLLKHVYFFI